MLKSLNRLGLVATLVVCLFRSNALAITWDDGESPPELPDGDGVSWNDRFNWDTDNVPTGVDHVILASLVGDSEDHVRVQDGFFATGASLESEETELHIDGALNIFGTLFTDSTIVVASETDSLTSGAALRVGHGSTLEGTGTIYLQRSQGAGVNPAVFNSVGGSNAVTVSEFFTIRGEGYLDASMINHGFIQAEDRDGDNVGTLRLGGATTNHSEIRTSPTAGILMQGNYTQSASGRLVADASNVTYGLGEITGGVFESENGGRFVFGFDGRLSNLTNNGLIDVTTGSTQIDLTVFSSGITNNGTITINSNHQNGNAAINFIGDEMMTLDGTGEVVLGRQNQGQSGQLGAKFVSGASTVTQAAGHTIRGEGQIMAVLINEGLVETSDEDSDGVGVLFITNSGGSNAFNKNIFRANDDGVIDLNGRLEQSSSGRLIAIDGGLVQFRQATLTNGSIETEGTGVAHVSNISNFVDVTNKGKLDILSGGSAALLNIRGSSFTNDGVVTINSDSTVSGARINFEDSIDLDGTGEIIVGGVGAGSIGITAGKVVKQQTDHTIQGRGQLLGTSGTLVNNGTLAGVSVSQMMDVNVILKGAGLLRDVFIDGIHSPGNPQTGSPTASVPIEGEYNFGNGPGINMANRLVIEIGGTTPGDEYDQLVSTDENNQFTIRPFGTTLDVSFIDLANGYIPAAGDRFTIIDSPNEIVGMFDNLDLSEVGFGRSITWAPIDTSDPTKMVLEITSVDFLDADFDKDFDVDGDDFGIWETSFGIDDMADADADGDSDGADFLAWQRQFGSGVSALATVAAIPEPDTRMLLAFSVALILQRQTRGRRL